MSKPVKIAICAGIVILVGVAGYFVLDRAGYIEALQLGLQLQQMQEQQAQNKAVLDSLGKIMLLPKDVAPTMAVINDVEVLKKEQPAFFSDAKNGDHVIIYPNMAIIYDYQANKIIHVGPVQISPAPEETQQLISDENSSTKPAKK